MEQPFDPALTRRCPKCRGTFDAPDIYELEDDLTHLDYLCPLCGYHFARWSKPKPDMPHVVE